MNLVYDDILKLNLKPVYAKRTSIMTSTSIACLEVLFLFHLQCIRPFGSTYGYAPLFISSPKTPIDDVDCISPGLISGIG